MRGVQGGCKEKRHEDGLPSELRGSDRVRISNEERDLTRFLDYAVKGFRDGLLNTLQQVQESQFKMSWMKLVHDRFAQRKMTNRNTFSRQRALMLELPPYPISIRGVPQISPTMDALYGSLSEKTIRRDLKALEEMDLVTEEDEGWRPKTELLGADVDVARRRRIKQASAQ